MQLSSCELRDVEMQIQDRDDIAIPGPICLIQCIASEDIYVKSTLNTSIAPILYKSSESEVQAALSGTEDVTGGMLNFAGKDKRGGENNYVNSMNGNLKLQCANKTILQVLHDFTRTMAPMTPSIITRAPNCHQ